MEEILRISGTVKDSVVDGPGHRFVIFTQGCHMNCEGCNRPENLDPTKGKSVSIDTLFNEIEEVKDNIDGVTFSGGEPFLQAEALASLGRMIKDKLNLEIITYTGYSIELISNEIQSNNLDWMRLLTVTDFIVDGKYEKDKPSDKFGSDNQRMIDVNKSDIKNEVYKIVSANVVETETIDISLTSSINEVNIINDIYKPMIDLGKVFESIDKDKIIEKASTEEERNNTIKLFENVAYCKERAEFLLGGFKNENRETD